MDFIRLNKYQDVETAEFFLFDHIVVGFSENQEPMRSFDSSYVETRTEMTGRVDSQYRDFYLQTVYTYYTLVIDLKHEKMQSVIEEYKQLCTSALPPCDLEQVLQEILFLQKLEVLDPSYELAFASRVLAVDYGKGCKFIANYYLHKYKQLTEEAYMNIVNWYLFGIQSGDSDCIQGFCQLFNWYTIERYPWMSYTIEKLSKLANKLGLPEVEQAAIQALEKHNRRR